MADKQLDLFCNDFSGLASCLFAIDNEHAAGLYAAHPEIEALIAELQGNLIKTLLDRTVIVFGNLTGQSGGWESLAGDFYARDYSPVDFNTGLLDNHSSSFASGFQSVLNIFRLLCARAGELTATDKAAITDALVAVLDVVAELREALEALGFTPCTGIDNTQARNNSPQLSLHTAGSPAGDGYPDGILLRWSLAGDVGRYHLPQADLHTGTSVVNPFVRPDDYVRLYRTPYTDPFVFSVDLSAAVASVSQQQAKWTYTAVAQRDGKTFFNSLRLYFRDQIAYRTLAVGVSPQQHPVTFLSGYKGLLDFALPSKTAYKATLNLVNSGSGDATFHIELYSRSDDDAPVDTPSARDIFSVPAGGQLSAAFTCDNIRGVRVQQDGAAHVGKISFETYDDFTDSRANNAWEELSNGFGLTLSDQEAYSRLEHTGLVIEHTWPQYRGQISVRAQNYRDKWMELKPTLLDYRNQSAGELEPVYHIGNADLGDAGGSPVGMVDIINLQALDYHVARMLGLGFADTDVRDIHTNYIYRINYNNKRRTDDTLPAEMSALSLPVGQLNDRLPDKPVLLPVTYTAKDENDQPMPGYDENGYDMRHRQRAVNIRRAPIESEISSADFFAGTASRFDLGKHQHAVLYGLEYRPSTDSNYQLPGITIDPGMSHPYYAYHPDFPENGPRLPETVPVMDNPNSLYLYYEKQEGIHYYAAYGIDIFSRPSPLSNEVPTDETSFPRVNLLTPPVDIGVQYIQPEDPRVFTSQAEQQWLQQRRQQFPGADTAFTRLSFNWLDVTDITFADVFDQEILAKAVRADTVAVKFKPTDVLSVSGVIAAVFPSGPQQMRLLAGSYEQLDGTTVMPVISAADRHRFIGSRLNAPEGEFEVLAVSDAPGLGIFIDIRQRAETKKVEDPDDPNYINTITEYVYPKKAGRITMTENLNDQSNWDQVAAAVRLISFADQENPIIEENVSDGEVNSRIWIGGIFGSATVLPLTDMEGQVIEGYYEITFDGDVSLPEHPDSQIPFDPSQPLANAPGVLHPAHVEFAGGKLRLPLQDPEQEPQYYTVSRIKSNSPLTLIVGDPNFLEQPVRTSQNSTDLISGLNFHPGYRVYLYPEPEPGHTFNRENILPAPDQNDKRTLIGLQSVDNRESLQPLFSSISLPVVLAALNQAEPEQPDPPVAGILKVRPDANQRAAFTFDVNLGTGTPPFYRRPFGISFFRVHNLDLLGALYRPETTEDILQIFNALEQDPYYADLWLALANLDFSGLPAARQIPLPDQQRFSGAGDLPAAYRMAVREVLLPLTEQVPVVAYIKTGKQTENRLPKIRSVDGYLLTPSDPAFNPFPMIRQLPGGNPGKLQLRFSDYSLEGASRFLYFFASAEVTYKLQTGPLSLFTGPVTILHTMPAEAPVVRNVQIGTGSAGSTMTSFRLSPFPATDTISKVRMYRSLDPQALTNHAGTSILDVPVTFDENGGILITDPLSDAAAPASGETVYYRFAFIRTIVNEFEELENIFSESSAIITVKLIDMVNPPAPELHFDAAQNRLSWSPTTNRGTYYLFRQNNRGNWQRIAEPIINTDNSPMSYTVGALRRQDEDGRPVYNRFRVMVENASGLFNLTDKELTI